MVEPERSLNAERVRVGCGTRAKGKRLSRPRVAVDAVEKPVLSPSELVFVDLPLGAA